MNPTYPDLILDVRAYFVLQGMDPLVAAHIPDDTISFHLADGQTFDAIYAICTGTEFAWIGSRAVRES